MTTYADMAKHHLTQADSLKVRRKAGVKRQRKLGELCAALTLSDGKPGLSKAKRILKDRYRAS